MNIIGINIIKTALFCILFVFCYGFVLVTRAHFVIGFWAVNFAFLLLLRWFLAQLIVSTLKMEAICSSETSVDTQRTTRRYIPEDGTLHNHRCENLKSYK
jgi:hypothetical protein